MGYPHGDQNGLTSSLGKGLIMHILDYMAEVHILLTTVSMELKEVTSSFRHDTHVVA